jgi:hypothetical protein
MYILDPSNAPDGWRCNYCGGGEKTYRFTTNSPVEEGGPDTADNLRFHGRTGLWRATGSPEQNNGSFLLLK